MGVVCDGYPPSKKNQRVLSSNRPLVPIVPKETLIPPPTTKLFRNDGEFQYFQKYCCITAAQLKGFRPSDLWTRIVLQTSESEACIRHAVTAIGALDFNSPTIGYEGLDTLRRNFAYHEYGLVISELKTAAAKGHVPTRTKLIACLLFACFEFYHGNNDIASALVLAGAEMVHAHSKAKSPYSPPIEDEIAIAVRVFEMSSIIGGNHQRPEVHLERIHAEQDIVENMPKEFQNLEEKCPRRAVLAIMLRGMHFVKACSMTSPVQDTFNTFSDVDPEYSQLCKHLAELRQWHKAFQPLLDTARTLDGKDFFRLATLVELQYLSGYLWIASAGPWQMSYYRYTKELAEIVRLSKAVLELSSNRSPESVIFDTNYSPDIRLVLPLSVVGRCFRHRALRREAIAILLTLGTRRDGVHDARMTAKILQWIADIEEPGLADEEYVPYHLAAKVVDLKTDMQAGKTFLAVLFPRRDGSGKSDLKKTTIYL